MGPNPLLEKADGIHAAGLGALRTGSVKPFTGFGPELDRRFNVSIFFDAASDQRFRRRLSSQMELVGEGVGIRWFLAGVDYPLHLTVLECYYQEGGSQLQFGDPAVFNRNILDQLDGTNVPMSKLVLDGQSVLLNCVQMPPTILAAREMLATAYAAEGATVRPMDNIVHSTAARMLRVPSIGDVERYVEAMLALRQEIEEEPITLCVSGVYTGMARQLLTPM